MQLTDPRQVTYELQRMLRREQWMQSDAEDWCARKGVEPGTYKVIEEQDELRA